jgi:hypothetical protein
LQAARVSLWVKFCTGSSAVTSALAGSPVVIGFGVADAAGLDAEAGVDAGIEAGIDVEGLAAGLPPRDRPIAVPIPAAAAITIAAASTSRGTRKASRFRLRRLGGDQPLGSLGPSSAPPG